MKLSHVRVHNFRSILEAQFNVADFGLLVGANNAGKTTVIDAIRCFYQKDGAKFNHQDDFPRIETQDAESWIELTFTLGADEAGLADKYKQTDGTLVVRRWFKTQEKMADDKTSATGAIVGRLQDGTLDRDHFYGAQNVSKGKLGEVIYVPAQGRASDHTKLTGPSAMRDLLNDIIADVAKSGESYGALETAMQSFSEAIQKEKTDDGRSIDGFASDFSDMLKPWGVEYKIDFGTPKAADIIKNLAEPRYLDTSTDSDVALDRYGSGFQRHFIFCLIQLAARYVPKKTPAKKDFVPDFRLLLFEEPEAFLHPPQQDQLRRSLAELTATENWQVLASTHSAHFVSQSADDLTSIVRLHRSQGKASASQISATDWDNIVNASQQINNILNGVHQDDLAADMEAIKHFLWMDASRAGLVFANRVLLVEGPTEVAFIRRLISDKHVAIPKEGVHVMDCIGKFNVHRFMLLCQALGIDHSILHDRDSPHKQRQADVNALIQATSDANLTKGIHVLDPDFEQVLGIPPAGQPHRKPQHALFHYAQGTIQPQALAQFSTSVTGLLN